MSAPWRHSARRALTAAGAAVVSLRPEDVVVAASRRAGSTELATEVVSEGLEVLCAALDTEAELHPRGRRAARRRLVGAMVERARTVAAADAHPELDARPDAPPWVVCGPPGSAAPVLAARLGVAGARAAGDGRRLEEGFASMEPELDHFVPTYSEWFDGADLTQGYRWLRRGLARAPEAGGPWLLDAPQHVERLGELLDAFGVRRVVVVDGEPDAVARSAAAAIEARRSRWSWRSEPDVTLRYWRWRAARMRERNRDQRDALTAVAVLDVDDAEVQADPSGVAARVADWLRSGG